MKLPFRGPGIMRSHGFTTKEIETIENVTKKKALRRRKRNFNEMGMFKLTISRKIINNWDRNFCLGLICRNHVIVIFFMFEFLKMKMVASCSGHGYRH